MSPSSPEPTGTVPTSTVRTSDNQLLCCKSIDKLIADSEAPGQRLQKTLGPWSLTALGIGAIIGSGIFILTGTAAAGEYFQAPSILHAQALDVIINLLRTGSTAGALMHGRPPAGPSIAISFFLVAIACSFAGLCYAELASMIPIAGSAYTYSYATLGEIFAWIIGWDLILEYAVSNVAVAVGFAGYTKAQLAVFGLNLPEKFASPVWAGGQWTGAYFNLPGFLIVFLLTLLLVRGVKESAETNNVMVLVKIGAIVTFLVVGGMLVKPANWHALRAFGVRRNRYRGGHRFLYLHRIRFGLDRRRGIAQSAKRFALRHHHVAGGLHRALCRRGRRPARHDEVHNFRFR